MTWIYTYKQSIYLFDRAEVSAILQKKRRGIHIVGTEDKKGKDESLVVEFSHCIIT